MVEDCPNKEVCGRLGDEPYGFLVSRFRKSDDLTWRTAQTLNGNRVQVEECQGRNGRACVASHILLAIPSSRQSSPSEKENIYTLAEDRLKR